MKANPYTDKEIIDAILVNKKEVLSFLYEYNFDSLNRKFISQGGCRSDTEDIFHDSLLILFLKLRKKDFQLTCSIHTYIQAIARNLWRQRLASPKNRHVPLDTDPGELSKADDDEESLHLERRKLYLRHLADMPEDCRRLIKMVLKGLSLQEITRRIPYNSIRFTKTKRFRCKVMLIKKILSDPLYKELKNERFRATGPVPRW
jgi:DNA-directed RNA polymerase specialized sigma24 family protein